jgi:hypothetical protein
VIVVNVGRPRVYGLLGMNALQGWLFNDDSVKERLVLGCKRHCVRECMLWEI